MSLESLKNDWESLAERDALNAILTDPSKTDGGWNVAEFLATGDAEMDVVMNHLREIGRTPEFSGQALDFGCGVGRLTQSLARRFASCTGIDISQRMVEKADALNQYPHCRYVVGSGAKLPFPDESFAFIYSNIVLQHMPARFAEQYLREFVRVLLPGGVLVFGVQDSFAAPTLASRLVRLRHILRIRARVESALGIGEAQMQIHCFPEADVRNALGVAQVVDTQFTNTADKDFNGRLVYSATPPSSGYVSMQYCAVKKF